MLIDVNATTININTLDQWCGVTTNDGSSPANTFFNFRGDCYDNEKLLYNKITSEALDQHGVKGDWYVVDYSTSNETVFGEDGDRHIIRNFPVKVYMELPPEARQYNQFGMEDLDNFVVYCNMLQYSKYSNYYIPKGGDLFRPKYNGIMYEIINVYNKEDQFLNTPHTWKFTMRVWRNNMIITDNTVTGEVQETYDKTNAIPDQPPENLTDVSVYTTSGSNALKQNDLINEEKTDILFDDPSNNINPFGDW